MTVGLSSQEPSPPARTTRFVVTTAGRRHGVVIAGEHRYAVPRGARGNAIAAGARVSTADAATTVPGLWLDLVTPGRPLSRSWWTARATRSTPASTASTPSARPVKVDGRPYVLGQEGLLPAHRLRLHASTGPRAPAPTPRGAAGPERPAGRRRTVNDAAAQPYPTDWPEQDVTPFDRGDAPASC